MNKGDFSLIGGMVAFGAALLMLAHPTPANTALPQATSANAPTRTLHTNGSAVVRVQPDKVTLRLGVETFAATAPESQSNAARLIAAVTKAVRSRGIAPQDIATDYFAVRPEYDYNTSVRKTTGYRTNNTVLITLHQVNKLSDILSAALEAGATSVDDVTFSTSRLRELRDQARTMAVKAALQKAHGLASAANSAAGDVQTIVDNSNWYYAGWGWNSRASAAANLANMTQNVIQAQAGSAGSGELPEGGEDGEFSLGQIVVQAQIDLTVELK